MVEIGWKGYRRFVIDVGMVGYICTGNMQFTGIEISIKFIFAFCSTPYFISDLSCHLDGFLG